MSMSMESAEAEPESEHPAIILPKECIILMKAPDQPLVVPADETVGATTQSTASPKTGKRVADDPVTVRTPNPKRPPGSCLLVPMTISKRKQSQEEDTVWLPPPQKLNPPPKKRSVSAKMNSPETAMQKSVPRRRKGKASKGQQVLSGAERQRRYMERPTADPDRHEAFRYNDRDRWRRRQAKVEKSDQAVRQQHLQQHLDLGVSHYKPMTAMDQAKLLFVKKVDSHLGGTPSLSAQVCAPADPSSASEEGWALKTSHLAVRFSEKQRVYLNEKFIVSEQSGCKLDGTTVSKQMRTARDQEGNRLLEFSEFLPPQQITSYFSRLASKEHHGETVSVTLDPAEAADDISLTLVEGVLPQAVGAVELSLQVHHPVMAEVSGRHINLCTDSSLHKFCIADLQTMCDQFDLVVEESEKTKYPFISALQNFLSTCVCQVNM